MKQFLLSMALLLAFCVPWAHGQTTPALTSYGFETGINSAKWVDISTGSTTIVASNAGDNGKSSVTNIGFTFSFGGTDYTQFSVNADGNLRLGSTVTGTSQYATPFSSTNSNYNHPKINAFGADGKIGANGYVKYKLTGTSPNQVLVVEFATNKYTSSTLYDDVIWQVQLFETSNEVQIVYSATAPTQDAIPATFQVGMCKGSTDVVTVNTSTNTVSTGATSTTNAQANWPAPSRYYRFYVPTCFKPTALTASNLTEVTADISWTLGLSETSWEYVYGETGFTPDWTNATTVATPNATLAGLTANTKYDFYVRSICSATDQSDPASFSFRTTCPADGETVTKQHHLTNDFEDVTTQITGNYYNIPDCWSKISTTSSTSTTYTKFPCIYNYASSAHAGSRCINFYQGSPTSSYPDPQILILPQVTNDVSGLRLKFWAKKSSSSYAGTLQVGVMTDPADATTFTQIGSDVTLTTTYAEYEIYLDTYTGSGSYVAIKCPKATSNSYQNIYLDDVDLSPMPSCFKPTGITVSGITNNQATLSWTPGASETVWNLQYKASGDANWSSANVSTNPYTLTGLDANSTYTFKMQSDCSDEQSEWTNEATFKTLCDAVTPENLGTVSFETSEGFTAGAGNMANCWTVGNMKTTSATYIPYVYNYSSYAHTGSNCMRINAYKYSTSTNNDSAYAVMPPIAFDEDITDYQVKFWMRKMNSSTYYNDTLYVGILSDPSDMSTLQIVGKAVNTTTTYNKYKVKFTNYTGGTTGYIVFLGAVDPNSTTSSKYGAFYVDDVTVELQPECEEPWTVTTTDVTRTSLTANWTFADGVPANCTGYEVVISENSDPDQPGVDTVSLDNPDTASCTFLHLDRATTYYVYVRALCGTSSYSTWVSASATTGYPVYPLCPEVTVAVPDETITTAGATINWTASTADYFGTYDLFVCDSAVTDLSLATPQFTGLTATTYTLDTLEEYSDYYVYVRANCNDEYGHDDGNAWSAGVLFKTLAKCAVPSNLVVENRSKTSAMLRWTTTAQGNNYRYFITTDSTAEPTTPSVQGIYADSVLITGLTPATTYYLYLSNNCGKTDGCSPWIPVSFTTVDPCLAPSNVQATDIQKYQATITWEPNPCADATDTYDMIVSETQIDPDTCQQITYPAIAGTSQVLTLLKRGTHYYIYVRANCGTLGNADWVNADFTTLDLINSCDYNFTVGQGTSTSYGPINAYYGYERNGYLFTPADGLTKATISTLSWEYTGSQNIPAKIYLKNTTLTDLYNVYNNGTWNEAITGATLVYDNTATTQSSGWTTIDITDFDYTGGNLMVLVASNYGGYGGGSAHAKYHTGPASSRFYVRQDNSMNDDAVLSTIGGGSTTHGLNADRHNIKFGYCIQEIACPTVTNVTVPEATTLNNQALITWNAGKGDFTSSYDVIVSPSQITDFSGVTPTATNIVDTFYTATGLTAENTYYVYVRANCQQQPYDDSSSVWSAEAQFMTEPNCVKPWEFQVTGVTSSTVSFQWINRNNGENWMLVRDNNSTGVRDTVDIAASSDTCRYTLNTGFTPNTPYYFGLSALCTDTSEMVFIPSAVNTLNNETNIRIDDFTSLEVIGEIASDTSTHTITATVRKGSDLTNVYINYTTSDYVSYVLVGSDTLMGYSHLDFTNPVTFTVVAEDTAFRQNWTVTLTEEACATVYNVAAENVSRRTADIVWNVGDNSTSFDFVRSTTELADPSTGTVQSINVTNVGGLCTYSLSGMDRETTYYVYVRTNCGATQGQWRDASFTTQGITVCDSATICDNSTYNDYIPLYGYYCDATQKSQSIYPASMLTDYVGKSITKLKYDVYSGGSSNGYTNWESCQFTIRMMATTATTLSNIIPTTDATLVYSGTLTASTTDGMEINLTTPFTYTGGNLLVEFDLPTSGGYSSCSFYGTDVPSASYLSCSSGGGVKSFLPKVEFGYCATSNVCPEVADLTVSAIQTTTATITWTATGDYPGTSDIYIGSANDTTGLEPTVSGITGTTYTATGLTPFTDYNVFVRTHCTQGSIDDGISPWAMTTFKTESACEYPRNVIATLTSKTSVNVTWTDAQGQTPTTAYEYAYSTTDAEPASGTASTTGSADITGLQAETTYYIYVRKVCDAANDNYSPWVKTTITMPAALPAVLNVTASDISFNAFTASWNRNNAQFANETAWQYSCVATGATPSVWTDVTDTFQVVSGLTESTPYDFYVRATDGQGNYSQNAMISVTTTAQPSDCQYIAATNVATTTQAPVYSNWGSDYSVSIYTAQELTDLGFSAGTINSITYYQTYCSSTYSSSYQKTTTVWMGNTTKSSFSGNTDWITSGLTKVKDAGAVDFNKNGDEVTIGLTTPFVWDGVSNIAVAVLANTISSYTNMTFSAANTSDYTLIYGYQDPAITVTDGVPNASNKDVSTNRPNIRFCFAPQDCPKPTHLTVDDISLTSARATWYPGGTESSWNYYLATEEMTDSALNATSTNATTSLVHPLTGLTLDTEYHLYVRSNCTVDTLSKWAHTSFITTATCSAPVNAVAVSNADNQITFDAAAGTYGTVGSYDYWYWKDGTTDTVKVNGQTATYVASNVAAGDYHWQVRANCGTTDGMSRWTAGNDVRVCGAYTLPYTQGFEEIPMIYTQSMIETICWSDINAPATASNPCYYATTTQKTEGSKSLLLANSTTTDLYVIMPEFLNADRLKVRYDCRFYSNTVGNLKFGYITNTADASTFVAVDSMMAATAMTGGWYNCTTYVNNLPTGARLAFCCTKGTATYYNYLYLDNIRVDTVPTYTLSNSVLPSAEQGTVEVICQATDTAADGRFYEGKTPSLKANAAAGFTFVDWSNGSTVNPLPVYMTQDTNIVANFDTISYHLNVVVSTDAGQSDMGDVYGTGIYKTGKQVTFGASNINEHYHVLWNDGSVENPRTITMPAEDVTYIAHFDIDTFNVTTDQNVDSMGTISGGGKHTYGETVTIEATPAAHHHFVQWTNGETNPTINYTVEDKDTTFTAIFRIDTVNITAIPNDVNRGEVTGAPGWVNYGTPVTLNVSAIYPYAFKKWSDNSTDTPYVFTATQDSALTAIFSFNDFTVTVRSNDNTKGTVTGGGTFLYGYTDTLTAIPNVAGHYHFVNWNNGVTSNPYYHVVTNDSDIVANFAIDQLRLDAVSNNTTMGSVTGAGVYDWNSNNVITATANAHYHFVNWSNGVFDATTTVNLQGDTTIVANFAIDRHNVSATANDPALGSVTGDLGDWDYGTEVTLTAVPMNNHVTFTSWSDGTTANPYSFTVTSDTTLTATFTLDRHLLSVWSGIGGTVSSGSMYDHGDTAYVWALPADHYHFTGWSDGNMNQAFYVVMDSNYSFTATFAIDQHVVRTDVNDNAAGTVSGAGTYNYGATATLTATANAHYEFVQWSNGATTATINVPVAGDTTLTAIFARDEHTITVNNNNPGMGTVAGGSVYTHGDMATITATANDHYHFTGWSNGVTANSFSIQVVKDSTVTANFAIDTHVVTTNVNNSAAGSVSGAGTYNWNATATLVATPADHYVFVNWSNGATTATINVTVAGDTTLTANFARDTHTITVNNNNPTMGSVSGGNTYTHGDMATITATANDHYHFTGWSNGVTATSFSFLVEKDSTVAANFAIDTHVVTTNVNNSAAGTVSGAGTYNWGATASLVATPADHYVFVNWSNGATTATINVTVAGDTTLTANFARDTHVITVNNNNPTMGSVSGGNTYTHGDMATITATANDHYHFVNWSNGVTNDQFSILVVEDSTVAANFAIDRHVATIVSADDALGTVTGGDTYDYGTQVTATATPAANYHFLQWSNGSTANPYTFTLTSDTMLVATFTIDTLNVTVLANDDNLGTVTGTGRYTWGEEATLTATPIDHYHVAGWSNGMTGDVITITVTSDTTVTAIFEIDTFFVTGNVMGVGEIDGLGVYNYGDTVMLVASETADNYDFAGWTGDTTGLEITDLSAYAIMFVVTRDVELTATFVYVPTSVDETEAENFIAFTEGMNVVVNGVEDHTVAIYDMTGKLVKIVKEAQDVERFTVHAAGVYLVRIDNKTTLRVVVK